MGDLKTAEDLVNSSTVQRYIDQIDEDAEAALDEMKANLSYASGYDYPSGVLSEYKGDGARLDSAWGDFNAAWNKVVFGKAKDSKEIISTYSKYVLALEILEEQNTRHSALADSRLAEFAAAFIVLLMAFLKGTRKRFEDLEVELKALEKLAKKAAKDVKGAEAQRVLNVVVTGISFCLGPTGLAARVGVAAGGIAVHMIIDAALGPSKGSVPGTVNTAAGEIAGVHSKLSPATQKLAGSLGAIVTLKMDGDEVAQARSILKDLQKRLEKAVKEHEKLSRLVKDDGKKLAALDKSLQSALSQARSKGAAFKSSKSKREGLIKEFEQWK